MKTDLFLAFQQSLPIAPDGKHLLAVSGGLDSMVLAELYSRSGCSFAIAHCNFQLRGTEAEADQFHVQEWAAKKKIPFFSTRFATQAYQQQSKDSLQMAARDLRYNWFNAIARVWGFTTIVTAHHLDDQLETFLIQLSRSNGLEGLRGIPALSQNYWRPLLSFTKAQLKDYAVEQQLSWREDSSNDTDYYTRNALRNRVIPSLKEVFPDFLERFDTSLSHLNSSYLFLEEQAQRFKDQWFQKEEGGFRIARKGLSTIKASNALLHHLFFSCGFKGSSIQEILAAPSGKFLESPKAKIFSERESLFLQWRQPSEFFLEISDIQALKQLESPFHWIADCTELPSNLQPNEAYLDKETLKFPLYVRNWQQGDYFYPTSFQGRKLLSKLFKDLKLNTSQKQHQLLLVSDSQIVWVIGKRLDRRFAATKMSKAIVALKTSNT